MKSVYIHIPFCKSICSYCDFCKVFYNPRWVHEYLITLKNEIMDYYMDGLISTLYIGGGTPSALSIRELEYLMEITKTFERKKDSEFTFECNLNDITKEMLHCLKKGGVNRLSIGIESFQEKKLKLMGRNHTFEMAVDKMKLIREMGFLNVNLDLMYGFYNETIDDLKKDLSLFLKLNPEHISTYSLMVMEHTLLLNQNIPRLSDDEDALLYQFICKELKHKYVHYEVSNFAKKGFLSHHNLHYWDNEEYYGFGLSASGYLDGVRYTNTFSLTDYLKEDYVKERFFLSKKDIMDNEIMLGLRKMEGISLENFKKKFEIEMKDAYPIEPLIKNKELAINRGYIYILPGMIYVSNEILIKLI